MGMITWSMCLCLCVCMCVCVCVCRCLELEVSRGRQRGEKVSSVVFAGRSVWIVPHITPPSRAFARLSSVHSSRRDPCFGGFCFSDLPAPDRGLSRTSRAALISLSGLDTYNPWIYLGVRTGLLQSGTLCPSRGAGDNSGGGGGGRGSGVNQRSGAEPRPASCSYYIQAANVRVS